MWTTTVWLPLAPIWKDKTVLREIVQTTMRQRSTWVAYLPGALDRIVANAPPAFISEGYLVDYVEAALTDEERRAKDFPVEKWFLLGWFDWFEHAHEMV